MRCAIVLRCCAVQSKQQEGEGSNGGLQLVTYPRHSRTWTTTDHFTGATILNTIRKSLAQKNQIPSPTPISGPIPYPAGKTPYTPTTHNSSPSPANSPTPSLLPYTFPKVTSIPMSATPPRRCASLTILLRPYLQPTNWASAHTLTSSASPCSPKTRPPV